MVVMETGSGTMTNYVYVHVCQCTSIKGATCTYIGNLRYTSTTI